MDKRIILVSLLLAACAAPPAPTRTATIPPTDTNTATPPPPTETATTAPAPTAVPLPELPEEFMAKFPNEEGYSIGDVKVVVDGEIWYELEDGQWVEKLWVYDALTSEEIEAVEIDGSSWGVVGERSTGFSEDDRVVAIHGKVVREYRKTIDGVTFVVIDMVTKIEDERQVFPLLLGTYSDDGDDLACYFRDGSNPEGSGLNCSASVVIDNVELGAVIVAEVYSSIDKSTLDYPKDNPGYEISVGWEYGIDYLRNHYLTYKSLMDKIISGDVASITPEEARLLLGVFELDIE